MLNTLLLAGEVNTIFVVLANISISIGYFLPAIFGRNQQNSKRIFLINLFLGWTIIGWLYALNLSLKMTNADKEAINAFRSRRHLNNPLT